MASQAASFEYWSRLPNKWIIDGGLSRFEGGRRLGASIAALKLLLAITLHARNDPPAKAGPHQGSASLSYDELRVIIGLSRELVSAGLKRLRSDELITVERRGGAKKIGTSSANIVPTTLGQRSPIRASFDMAQKEGPMSCTSSHAGGKLI